jgi:hypothetical protein
MLLSILFSLVVWGIIFYVLWWAQGAIGLPQPFAKVAIVILVLAAVYVIIGVLTGHVAPFGFLSDL